jgi:hypothetical protein
MLLEGKTPVALEARRELDGAFKMTRSVLDRDNEMMHIIF